MKIIVRESVNKLIEPEPKVYQVTVETTPNVIPSFVGQAKGDIIVFQSKGDPVRLPVGSNGQVLVADSTQPLGVRWKTP